MGSLSTRAIGLVGLALLVIGVAVTVYLQVASPRSLTRHHLARYVGAIDRELKFLFIRTSAWRIVGAQAVGVLLIILAAYLYQEYFILGLVPPLLVIPYAVLRRRHDQRVIKIEDQLDSWLLLLANALKAVPSIGEALAASAKLTRVPISQELDLCLKELQLGSPLDEAILSTARRIDSPIVSGALATLLIARQTGGDLPKLLEQQAATLREIARLEGVVRTKTAEGRSQAWVLSVVPFVLVGMIYKIDPHWLKPLTQTTLGFVIIGTSIVLWALAIIAARKILAVDV